MTAYEFPPKEEFKAWLKARDPDTIIAQEWSFCDCPLALWLYSKWGFDRRVDIDPGNGVWSDFQGDTHELPKWAAEFGRRIDDHWELPVLAGFCLQVLSEVSE